ncbi:signal peptidase I [Paenibacillus sp. GP183]|jgi:signal peptidase I|uniref:signal peptidase I n=1 Tax=Paenibacillus sp. GP183 TaxID=1882751 RepID=UPI00089617C3|nr:signal peptidase I [Paenibacillus sp. GP183]SEC43303.1 signal peptidase I [Paenibacillus sp. GP183]
MRLSVLIMLIAVVLPACTQEPLRDNETKQDINKVRSTEGMNVYQHGYDNMDRGHHEFDGVDIVVDQTYYKTHSVQRGDIIYYRNPKLANSKMNLSENEISRVVALPGEKFRIDKGQIYIDGRQLDSFYGQAHRLGMNVNELIETSNRSEITDNIRNNFKGNAKWIQESDDSNKKEIQVPNGQYYIIGDDWFRSADSRHFGTISKESILGKVLGYKE